MFHHFPIFISGFELLCMAGIGLASLCFAFLAGRKQVERQLDAEAIQEAALDRYFENLLSAKIDLSIGKN